MTSLEIAWWLVRLIAPVGVMAAVVLVRRTWRWRVARREAHERTEWARLQSYPRFP